MDIKKVGVLGAGTMGAGIAQVCAEAGLQVVMVDVEKTALEKAIKGVNKSWRRSG